MQDYIIDRKCLTWMLVIVAAGTYLFADSPGGRKASIVAIDKKSGRLVRTVVVAPRVIEPKVVTPVEIGGETLPVPDAAINELVEDAARRNGVDPLLVHSVIRAESNYNTKAVSNRGAQGLMQLMPATAKDLGVKNAMDPKDNIEGGVKYLKYLQNQFSDTALALAAYNAGEGAVRRYNWIPPYPETQDYVVKVARNYKQAKASAKPVAAAIAAAKQPLVPAEPPPPQILSYYDAQGRLNMRTITLTPN